MFIEPSTNVRLLKGVPLENSYEHTLYFDSVSAQASYFSSLAKHTFVNFTYQRQNKGKIRVHLTPENVYDCNYMMYQNSNYGNKWFYAFINKVHYINNECAELDIETDVMQTWFFDYQMGHCFVERNHTFTDEVGEHLVDEGIDFGGNIVVEQTTHFFKDWSVIIQSAPNTLAWLLDKVSDVASVDGMWLERIYSACKFHRYLSTQTADINNTINNLITSGYNIINVYMCPNELAQNIPPSNLDVKNKRPTQYGDYIPKNNKLFTFPYTYLQCSNNSGATCDFEFERMSNDKLSFIMYSCTVNKVECMLVPLRYDNIDNNYSQTLALSDFPICTWSENGLSTAIGNGSLISSALSGLSSVLNNVGNIIKIPATQGNTANGYVQTANLIKGFVFNTMGIKQQYAKILDDFFTKYGYKIDEVKIPNRNCRPHWTYVKTKNCVLTKTNLPSDDEKQICNIYNDGITFWVNGSEVGNYALDNKY